MLKKFLLEKTHEKLKKVKTSLKKKHLNPKVEVILRENGMNTALCVKMAVM